MLSKYPTELKRIRLEVLKVSRETIAKRTNITTYTVGRAEDGFPVKYSSAQEITSAINSLLADKGLEHTTMNELGLNLE